MCDLTFPKTYTDNIHEDGKDNGKKHENDIHIGENVE